MNVSTLILQLSHIPPDDEVILIIQEGIKGDISMVGKFNGKVIRVGTSGVTGKCEIYGVV